MQPYLLGFGIVVVLVVWVWASRRAAAASYRRYVSEDHLLEMLEIVAALKQSALDHIEEAGQEAALPHASCMRTSREGVRVVYTITREAGGYLHHYSLQTAGGPTPPPVGEMLMLFVATMLGFPEGQVAMERSRRGIYHGEVTLTEEEQQTFIDRSHRPGCARSSAAAGYPPPMSWYRRRSEDVRVPDGALRTGSMVVAPQSSQQSKRRQLVGRKCT